MQSSFFKNMHMLTIFNRSFSDTVTKLLKKSCVIVSCFIKYLNFKKKVEWRKMSERDEERKMR